MTQSRREIQALLASAGLRPLKQLGQHFLVDARLMGRLVAAAEITPADVVLEVGPGTGSLTERLLEASGHVVAVELDRGLAAVCRDRLDQQANFTLLHRDVLAAKSRIDAEVLAVLVERQGALGGRLLLVANLPYQVASALIVDLLLGSLRVSPLCFTVQAEVADRIAAKPGNKTYGPLSILTQALASVRRIARVPPQAFWPVPKVHSTMLRLDVHEHSPPPVVQARLVELVQGCFQHRRKTMRSNLRNLLQDTELQRVARNARWRLEDRPEDLSVNQWLELAALLANE